MDAFGFRFDVGSVVHFGRGGKFHEVKWRGWLLIVASLCLLSAISSHFG